MVLTDPLSVELVLVLGAVEEHSHVGVHSVDGEHEPDDEHHEGDVDDGSDRLEQSSHDHLELRVVRDHT